jgi:hypothetical protein
VLSSLFHARKRRGAATLALVLGLFLALGAIMLGAVTVASMAGASSEREYRRTQAQALAEAAIAEAQTGVKPHAALTLAEGTYSWSEQWTPGGRLITARGEVESVSGARITRTIHAVLSGRKVKAWEEGP